MTATATETATGEREWSDTYPLDFNGYVVVARPAMHITADKVEVGDILLLDSFLSKVTYIDTLYIAAHPGVATDWPVLHIKGAMNIIRFPHEVVSVIRP